MKTIYVADDDPTISKLIEMSLSKLQDVKLVFFNNGLDLYRQIQQSIPDAVVTDIILPKLDGLAVARLIKFDEQYKKIPLLIVSSVIDPDISEQVRRVGADDFLRKPFRANDIREKVLALTGTTIR